VSPLVKIGIPPHVPAYLSHASLIPLKNRRDEELTMIMPGLFSEVYAEAEVAYRREQMLGGTGRMHRRAHPFHWRRRKTESEPQPPSRDTDRVTTPARRHTPAVSYPHRG
jgi:hypothetical protein